MEDKAAPTTLSADISKWYTGPELAQQLGISQQRVGQLRRAGRLPGAIERGGTWFYPVEAVRDYNRLSHKPGRVPKK